MELSSNVHLSHKSNNRYQLLYNSQLYGTFFSIYGKFTVNESGILSHVAIKLVNYKGLINIGIKKFHPPKIEEVDLSEELNLVGFEKLSLHLVVEVEGFSNKFSDDCGCDLAVDTTNEDFYVVLSRHLQPMDDDALDNRLFDEEFYYRDGLRTIPVNRVGRDLETGLWDKANPGRICPRGVNKVLY